MSKKFFSLILLFSCVTLLVGCNEVKDLTDDETRLIAEYAAELLLKYDLNYTDRIAEGEKEAADMDTEELMESVISDTQESSQEDVTTEETASQDSSKGQNVDNKIDGEDGVTNSENSVGTENDIAKIASIAGAAITYKDYLITEQYPATDEDTEAVYLEPSEGYQLLVVRFKVANVTGDTINISLLEKELDYRIVCNGNKAANPMLTILMEDLGTLEVSVNPGEEQEAVLVFQISDDMKDSLESIELNIHYNDMDNVIKIL